MKYLSIPKKLLAFWYPEGIAFFVRLWKNTFLLLEEDLAIALMVKLLFVPLFHDTTIIGRFLSLSFRLFRIFVGVMAVILMTFLIVTLAISWLLLPVLAVVLTEDLGLLAKGLVVFGLALFLYHLLAHPAKKLWQVKSLDDLWQASFVKKGESYFSHLLKTPEVKKLLLYLEQTPDNFLNFPQSQSEAEVLTKVWEIGKTLLVPYLGPEHFFVARLFCIPGVENILVKYQLKLGDFYHAAEFLKLKKEYHRPLFLWDDDFQVRHLRGINRGWLNVPTHNLDLYSEDLTRKAAREDLPDFLGRGQVVNEVVNILSLQAGRNVVIVGEPGSGKTSLVYYLAKLIIKGNAPSALATKRLISLDFTKLISGIKTQGELAERIKTILDEAVFCGNLIIFIDEIQNLGLGELNSQFNLYSLLVPYIESSKLQFIATSIPGIYAQTLERNGALARLFARVDLMPASAEESWEILRNLAIKTERQQKIKTTLPALQKIIELTTRYIHNRVLPDAVLLSFNECLVKAEQGWVKKATVEQVIQTQVNVPIGEVESTQKERLLGLENIIHQKLIDQEEAVRGVATALRRAAVELREKNRPIGSFLFVGPTGVGKTELSKVLADVYFAGTGRFVRFDMSEYQTVESVERLIGKTGEAGNLTEEIRNHPYALILLDEFEKADPKILNIFLQVLEDGRLTDGLGRTIDFTNTIIIATSNAGNLLIAEGLKQERVLADLEEEVQDELLKVFKPELLNRFDEVVLFKPLVAEDLQKIIRLKLLTLQKRLKEQGYLVEFDDQIVSSLAQKGFDPVLGARPLRRLIQDTIEARLSVKILENKLPKGEVFKAGVDLLGMGPN